MPPQTPEIPTLFGVYTVCIASQRLIYHTNKTISTSISLDLSKLIVKSILHPISYYRNDEQVERWYSLRVYFHLMILRMNPLVLCLSMITWPYEHLPAISCLSNGDPNLLTSPLQFVFHMWQYISVSNVRNFICSLYMRNNLLLVYIGCCFPS